MKPSIRTYILVVGRDSNDKPYRAVAEYHVPLPQLTDDYDAWSNTKIKQAVRQLEAERELATDALADLEAESIRRLEAIK